MGLDLFIHCYRNGEPATFKRHLAEEVLSRHAINYRPPLTYVECADGSRAQVCGADEEEDIHDLMFTHCGPGRLLDSLYELAERTRSLIMWPFGSPLCAVTSAEHLPDIPMGIRESPLGPPFVVTSGRGIYEAILPSGSTDARKA